MAAAKITELTDSNICKLCENALGKYSCPRCNVLYCSLNCYQSEAHLKCSELFYRDCVFENMHLDQNDTQSQAKMLEILKRAHEDNTTPASSTFHDTLYAAQALESDESQSLDSDDEEYVDLGERLAGVDLNDANEVWQKLNSDEQQEFEAFLRSDDISKYLPKWEPWWMYRCDKKVEEVEASEDYKQNCPKIKENIVEFVKLQAKAPSDLVKYNLINIITAYTFTTRYFNGDYCEFSEEAVSCLVSLSLTLKANHIFEDFSTAVESVVQESVNSDWIMTDEENLTTCKEDLEKIVQGPNKSDKKYYVLCALSDLHSLMGLAAKKEKPRTKDSLFSQRFPESQFPAVKLIPHTKIKAYMKKIEYFLSYTLHCFEY